VREVGIGGTRHLLSQLGVSKLKKGQPVWNTSLALTTTTANDEAIFVVGQSSSCPRRIRQADVSGRHGVLDFDFIWHCSHRTWKMNSWPTAQQRGVLLQPGHRPLSRRLLDSGQNSRSSELLPLKFASLGSTGLSPLLSPESPGTQARARPPLHPSASRKSV
jgi:hypothetical protein